MSYLYAKLNGWAPGSKIETSVNLIMTIIFPIGAIFGSLIGAASCRNFGRRMTMIYCDLIAMIGTILTAMDEFSLVIVGRFIVGVMVGINCVVVPIFIHEMTPREINGNMGAMF